MAVSAAAVQEAPATKFAKDQLKAIIERIERLDEEKKTISDDIRDVYAVAQAGRQRARRAGNHPGNLYAGARNAVSRRFDPKQGRITSSRHLSLAVRSDNAPKRKLSAVMRSA